MDHPVRRVSLRRSLCRRALTVLDPSFDKRDDLRPGAMVIECSHDDFTTVPSGEEFSVRVSYNRPIEGAHDVAVLSSTTSHARSGG